MDELPAGPADLIAPFMGKTVTGTHDLAQFFDIEVEQFTGMLALNCARPEEQAPRR